MSVKWDIDTTIKFIQLYKLHPCLWDFSSSYYKNKQKRDAAYISIVEEMNINGFGVQEAKNKIKNLRSTYSQELKKVQDSKKSGAGLNNVYISNIKWLHEMEEVFSKDLKKIVFENINQTDNEGTQSQASGVAVSSQETPTNKEPPSTATTSTIGNTPRPKKRTRDIIKAVSDLKKMNDDINHSEETVWDAFGNSVAQQLKTFSVENALLAQCRIQSILTEFGLKNYREKTTSRSATSYHSNHRPSSVLSDYTDITCIDSSNICISESVSSPPQETIVFVTSPEINNNTATAHITQPAIPVTRSQPQTEPQYYSNDIIISAAINAASAFESNYYKS